MGWALWKRGGGGYLPPSNVSLLDPATQTGIQFCMHTHTRGHREINDNSDGVTTVTTVQRTFRIYSPQTERERGPPWLPAQGFRIGVRPLLSGWLILYRGGGGGSEAKKKVCVPKIDLQVRAPLINFIFFLRKNFLMWVGGWVSQNPGGPI